MDTQSYALAAIFIVVIIIAAGYFYTKSRSDGSRSLKEAVAFLGGDLACIARIADSAERRGKEIEKRHYGSELMEARLSLNGARRSMTEIITGVKRLRAALGKMEPTYYNVYDLYQGLRVGGDKTLWVAARALAAAGERMQHLTATRDGTNQILRQELNSAAIQLKLVSSGLYGLIRSINSLGGALRLE